MAATDRHSKSNGQGQGMNFVRKDLRLALYLRDGLACCYCGHGIEDGARLTLDHLMPVSQTAKPDNRPANLATACHRCNSSRGNRDWREFAAKVAGYLNHGIAAEDIISHIEATIQRPVDRKASQALIAARGGFTQALRG